MIRYASLYFLSPRRFTGVIDGCAATRETMEIPVDEPPQDALGRLQWSWGSAYGIAGAWGTWVARRRDNGRLLNADSPDRLRELLLRDHQDQPVPREAAP